jgi:hypothetical protein
VAVERKKIERHEDGMRDVSLPPHYAETCRFRQFS